MKIASVALALVLASCGSTTGPPLPDAPSLTIASIDVTPGTAAMKRGLDAPKQLAATAMLSNQTMRDVTTKATWSSDNPAVATVSDAGLVTPVGAGTVMITAQDGNSQGSATITVTIPKLFVTQASPIGIDVFDVLATGATPPLRSIRGGTNTTLTFPWKIEAFNNELYVADQSAIDVFPIEGSGDIAPTRRITGAMTTISGAYSLAIFNNELYVGSLGKIQVFPVTASGNVAPTRTITNAAMTNIITALTIYNNELYVVHNTTSILVFPVTASGDVAPTRTIAGAQSGLGTVYDLQEHNGELLIGSNQSIEAHLPTTTGNIAPLRQITGPTTQLGPVTGMFLVGNEMWAMNASVSGLTVFSAVAVGNVAPLRQLTGAATLLSSPRGLVVY